MIEETRSALDKNGVYVANVMVEGVKKKARSSFFPKHWSQEEVEQAILEAYAKREREPKVPALFFAIVRGVRIRMQLKPDGQLHTVFPVFEGPKGP